MTPGMHSSLRKASLIAIFLLSIVMKVSAQAPVVEGISYYLPKTAVKFTLLIEKSTFTPGELSSYANKYFQQDASVLYPQTYYRIINMQMDAIGVADTAKHHTAIVSPKNSINNVYTTTDGVLLSVNVKPTPMAEHKAFVPATKPAPLKARDYMSQEILSANNKSKMAQLCAREIFDIRDARNELSRGQADVMPKDGLQLKQMMQTMDTQEKALYQLFCGTTVNDTIEQTIVFCPDSEVEKAVLFRFSEFYGLVESDNLAGAPYYISVKDMKLTPEDLRTEKEKKQKDATGLFVNVPGRALITVYNQENKLSEKNYPFAQFGRTENVSPLLFSKKIQTSYHINPSAGNMVGMESVVAQ